MYNNYMKLSLPCIRDNEEVISSAVLSFAKQLNPTICEMDEIRIAVGEAIDNCIIFAYPNCDEKGLISVSCKVLKNNVLSIIIKDNGVGIEDVEKATQPLFSKSATHSGMGFDVMEAFMTECKVSSIPGKGTTVNMKKRIG